eukprot:m.67815 g.67815  ORF g.67815 m.67815 type:complete len:493 (-) comp23873_c0_seq2:37-1515(-)
MSRLLLQALQPRSRCISMQARKRFRSSAPSKKVFDVVIVGGGLVGSSLACSIGCRGSMAAAKIAVLDFGSHAIAPPALGEFSNRCTSLTPSSVDFFKTCGVWEKIAAMRMHPYASMQVWDGCSEGHIWLDAVDVGEQHMAVMVENEVMQHALDQRMSELGNIEIIRGANVASVEYRKYATEAGYDTVSESTNSSCVAVKLACGDEHLGKLVVGADGPRSAVKVTGGFSETGWKYDQTALVATLEVSSPFANNTAWQRFLPTGPVALLPLSETHSSLVWSTSPSEAKRLVALADYEFVGELNHVFNSHFEEFLPKQSSDAASPLLSLWNKGITNFSKQAQGVLSQGLKNEDQAKNPPLVSNVVEKTRASFPLSLANADQYVRPRIALAGDAAHKVHPLAGQGLNLGLGDARELASTVTKMHELGLDVGDVHSLLEYERTRQRAVLPVMAATDFFKRIFSTSNATTTAIRSLGVLGTNAFSPLKKQIIKIAMGS